MIIGNSVNESFSYNSADNKEWLDLKTLKKILKETDSD